MEASNNQQHKKPGQHIPRMQQNQPIEIIEYTPALKEHIKALNYEWLQKYFAIEAGDARSLSYPQQEIIDKGGFIYYAKLNNEIVGTASLLKKEEGVFEIGKMAVTASAQGQGIGALLLDHCIHIAKEKAAKKLILYSNTKLAPAMHLYKKVGFVQTDLEVGLYERADIKMEKLL